MIKINYPETKPTIYFEVFKNAQTGQMFLVTDKRNDLTFLAQKTQYEASKMVLISIDEGNRLFEDLETRTRLASGEYAITPVDVEITVTHK